MFNMIRAHPPVTMVAKMAPIVTNGSPYDCRKSPINVPYKRTFGMPDQGQMLDV